MLGFSQGVASGVPPRVTSQSPRSTRQILMGFVDVGFFSRYRAVGAALGDLLVSHTDIRIIRVLAFSVARSHWTLL